MLDAARAAIRFCCPGCGAGLRAAPHEAGTAITCHLCGEAVRVPRRPHPLECDLVESSLISIEYATHAQSGVVWLWRAAWLAIGEYVLRIAVVAYWIAQLGPARVLGRDTGDLRGLLFAIWLFDLALVSVRLWWSWQGYRHCEPAAAALRATGWITATRVGLCFRTVGYLAWSIPFALGLAPAEGPFLVNVLSELGRIVWLAGLVIEFSILFVWARFLTEMGGREAARRVHRHAITAVVSVLVFAAGTMIAGLVTALSFRQTGEPPPAVRGPIIVNYDLMPDEGWSALAGLVVLAVFCALILGLQYLRILQALRTGFTAMRD